MNMPLAVALFSGGLDSMLAVRLMQQQGFAVEALNVQTPFHCCAQAAAEAAHALGIPQTVVFADDDYVDLVRRPRHGYGKAVNPCVDCRIHMAAIAGRHMRRIGACVVITGEVIGQRPNSQKRNHLELIARRSGLEDRLLRPLSARLLAPTIVERQGVVDREQLGKYHGRGRRQLIALARRLDVEVVPPRSTGCALTETSFAPRVRDLIQFVPEATTWDFELLGVGRHVRIDHRTKAVIGRNAEDNAALRRLAAREDAGQAAQLEPEGFIGPDALVVGRVHETALRVAGTLIVRYTRRVASHQTPRVRITHDGATRVIELDPSTMGSAGAAMSHLVL